MREIESRVALLLDLLGLVGELYRCLGERDRLLVGALLRKQARSELSPQELRQEVVGGGRLLTVGDESVGFLVSLLEEQREREVRGIVAM